MTLRPHILLPFCAVTLLLAGCGDDRPASGPPHPRAASRPPTTPPAIAAPTVSEGDDPLATPDQMAGAEDAPLEAQGAPRSDDDTVASGPHMPTRHSHWLNVAMADADMTVRLDGIQIGGAYPVGTRDITMRLHPGPNQLAVTYAPHSARAWASVTVVEGEHDPPVPPLASFRQSPRLDTFSARPGAPLKPVTQTSTFIAH